MASSFLILTTMRMGGGQILFRSLYLIQFQILYVGEVFEHLHLSAHKLYLGMV